MSKPKKHPMHDIAQHIARRVKKATAASRRSRMAREARAAYELLQRHATQLSEHFSSVQITATKIDPNGSTSDFAAGSGDLHARVHMAGVWVDRVEGFYQEGM